MTDLLQRYPNLAILTLDELSLYFQATLKRVWAPVGHPPVVSLPPQRDNIHFYGALELRIGREIALPAHEQTSLTTATFVRLLLLLFPTQPILLLLDRAPWHFGEELTLLFAESQDRLHVLYYPPACPELNPQEHVWSQARDNVSHNHTFVSFPALIDAFDTYLNETPFETNFMDKYAPPFLPDCASLF